MTLNVTHKVDNLNQAAIDISPGGSGAGVDTPLGAVGGGSGQPPGRVIIGSEEDSPVRGQGRKIFTFTATKVLDASLSTEGNIQ